MTASLWKALVGVEGAVAVGGVHVPAAALLIGDDVDYAAQRVRAEAHGHHALIDLDALGEVDGQVVQVERLSRPFLRHTVDEYLHVLAAEAVQHQLHVRAYSPTLAELHAGCFGQDVAQALGGVLHLGGIHRHGVEGRTLHPCHPAGDDHDFLQLLHVGAECPVLRGAFSSAKRQGLLHGLIADGGHHQGVFARGSFQRIASLGIGCGPIRSAFKVDRGKVYHSPFGRGDLPGKDGAMSVAMVMSAPVSLGIQVAAARHEHQPYCY